MIQDVYLDHSTYAAPPMRFEAGTPAIAEAVGLGAACDYLQSIGMDKIQAFEEEIGGYLYERLTRVPGVKVYGPSPSSAGGKLRGRASLSAFNVEGLHATDVSTMLDMVSDLSFPLQEMTVVSFFRSNCAAWRTLTHPSTHVGGCCS